MILPELEFLGWNDAENHYHVSECKLFFWKKELTIEFGLAS